jgi:hypothetical protein
VGQVPDEENQMARDKSLGARTSGRRLVPPVRQPWLGVVVAVIALAMIALMVVLFIRHTAGSGNGCGVDMTNERVDDAGWSDAPENVGEDGGCSAPFGGGAGGGPVRHHGAWVPTPRR